MFNYIITIHNKEKILEDVLNAIEVTASNTSKIYPVLDGCTDKSEEIVEDFKKKSSHEVIVTKTPDLHELRSINAALEKITRGYNFILQDDVILLEKDIEKKIIDLYCEHKKLGVLSFCRATDLRKNNLKEKILLKTLKNFASESNLIKAEHDLCHGGEKIPYNKLKYAMCSIKSPICIPEHVFKKIGMLDDDFAPHTYDDHDYSIRALKAGFMNALYPIRFRSDIDWGGTRNSETFLKEVSSIHKKNRLLLWKKHGDFISNYKSGGKHCHD